MFMLINNAILLILLLLSFVVFRKVFQKKYVTILSLTLLLAHILYIYERQQTAEVSTSVIFLRAFSLIFVLSLLLISITYLFIKKYTKKEPFSAGRRQALLAITAAIPTSLTLAKGLSLPSVQGHTVFSQNISPELDGKRILQITDMHISSVFAEDWCQGLVERVNEAQADIVVFTGDMADGFFGDRKKALLYLRNINAPMVAAFGNHDYYYNLPIYRRFYQEEVGIHTLENSSISFFNDTLSIGGVSDSVAERFGQEAPHIYKAFSTASPHAFRLFLNHRPTLMQQASDISVDLQLSGHTHGGQLYGIRNIVSHYNDGYLYGWYTIGKTKLYVGSGAALWGGAPVRLGTRNELPVFTLQRQS